MKCMTLLAFAMAVFLAACNDTKRTPTQASTTKNTEFLTDKFLQEAKAFEDTQETKWKAISEQLEKDTTDPCLEQFKDTSLVKKSDPIDVKYAKWYINLYENNPSIKNDPSHTNSVWIDRKAIFYIARELAQDPSTLDGVRLYFARYPDENCIHVDRNLKHELHDRYTIIFVATKPSSTNPAANHEDTYEQRQGAPNSSGLYIYDYNSLCPSDCPDKILSKKK